MISRTWLEQVCSKSRFVRVNHQNLTGYVHYLKKKPKAHWLTVSPFQISSFTKDEQLGFLFVLDAISFCYWGEPKWTIEYKGNLYDGAQAMMASLGRAIEEGIPLYSSDYLRNISIQDLRRILQGNVEIPLFEERLQILWEMGDVVSSTYNGSFRRIIEDGNDDAERLVRVIEWSFLSFQDTSLYKGIQLPFQKRAQLLASDIHALISPLKGIENLTGCADYKIPQVLRRHRVLEYAPELESKIRRKEELKEGSDEETEIRVQALYAISLLAEQTSYAPMEINDWLWLEGQVKLSTDEPYHRTHTIRY